MPEKTSLRLPLLCDSVTLQNQLAASQISGTAYTLS